MVSFETVNAVIGGRAEVLGKALGLPLSVKQQSGIFAEAPAANFDLTYLLPPLGYRLHEPIPVHPALGGFLG